MDYQSIIPYYLNFINYSKSFFFRNKKISNNSFNYLNQNYSSYISGNYPKNSNNYKYQTKYVNEQYINIFNEFNDSYLENKKDIYHRNYIILKNNKISPLPLMYGRIKKILESSSEGSGQERYPDHNYIK